jgi:hypothetical protein
MYNKEKYSQLIKTHFKTTTPTKQVLERLLIASAYTMQPKKYIEFSYLLKHYDAFYIITT